MVSTAIQAMMVAKPTLPEGEGVVLSTSAISTLVGTVLASSLSWAVMKTRGEFQ